MRAKLDHNLCVTAICEPGRKRTDYWDTITTGFVLEVRSSGGRSFYLRYFDSAGRQRQHLIGRFGDITFDQARKAAKRLRSEVVLGGDPLAAKQRKRSVPTFETLAAQVVTHVKTYQRSWWSVEGIIRKHLVPRWGRVRLDEIHSQDVAKWLAEKGGEGLKPATVEKIRVVFGRAFELARQWNIPGAETNPVRGVPRPKYDNRRSRYMTTDEVRRLLAAAEASPNPQLKAIVHLLILTGARLGELLTAERVHVDTERRTWFIPMSKNGKGRHVPLASAAVEVIERLPVFEGSPYLVPNPETGRPFVTIKRAWQTARTKARLPGLRLHDLRHHCAGALVNSGASLYTVAKVLGHRDLASSERYSFLAQDTLLAAVEAGAAEMSCET